MIAKRFFYVSAGLLLLALTYHLGARSATAQAGATGFGYSVVSGFFDSHYVMTPTGDVYMRQPISAGAPTFESAPPARYIGNFWGGATPATSTTWGKVKADYRK